MRNPLKRLARRDHPRIPLRDRLGAAKARLVAMRAKAATMGRINLAMVRPEPGVGEHARPPLGFLSPDAGVLDALDLLSRTHEAQQAFLQTEDDGADRHPAYRALEAARDDALARLRRSRAQTLAGLQAKAKAIRVNEDHAYSHELVESLICDLLDADERALLPRS